MRRWTESVLVQLSLSPEPMLTYCQLSTSELQWNFNRNTNISTRKMHFNMSSATWPLLCSGRIILIYQRRVHKTTLRWHHNGRDGVSNHQPHDCLLCLLFRRRSKKTSKLGVTGLCAGNSPATGEFPAQMASNAENASIWWRHHENDTYLDTCGYISSQSIDITTKIKTYKLIKDEFRTEPYLSMTLVTEINCTVDIPKGRNHREVMVQTVFTSEIVQPTVIGGFGSGLN